MTDIEKAREILENGGYTCVLCSGDTVYTSTERGVVPVLQKLEQKVNIKDFSAADKVIGKAAAMLFHLSGVKALYSEVMSVPASEYLKGTDIVFSYGTLTDKIINRRGDGLCPMESAVMGIDDPAEAYEAIKNKLNELRKA